MQSTKIRRVFVDLRASYVFSCGVDENSNSGVDTFCGRPHTRLKPTTLATPLWAPITFAIPPGARVP
eukprot:7086633-Pyramimonas_sp.AAC.1